MYTSGFVPRYQIKSNLFAKHVAKMNWDERCFKDLSDFAVI